jgi:hypothetical protein
MWHNSNIWGGGGGERQLQIKFLTHDKIESRLNSGNSCFRSVQKHLSSRLLHKKRKHQNILPREEVSIDGVWIGDWIY